MLVSDDTVYKLFSYVGCTSEAMETSGFLFFNRQQTKCQISESESMSWDRNLSGWCILVSYCVSEEIL
jgi:hypothetical protein